VEESDPFLLVASFDEPHPPVVCPAACIRLYADVDVPLPETLDEDLSGKPETHRESNAWLRQTYDLGPETLPDGIRLWYAATSFVDEQVGRILDVIDRRFGDNTIVIFTSDHGDQLGAHGLCGKGPAMYEECVKVPLLVRVPGLTPAGAATRSLASTMDLLPTLCDLAGLPAPASLHGISLRPVLTDPGTATREHVMIGYNRLDLGRDALGGFSPARTLVDNRYKLIVNLLDRDELYDLQEDPLERTNRIDDETLATTRDALHDKLMEDMQRTGDFLTGKAMRRRPWRSDPKYRFTGA
jgi:uncharacterized sulfatase